MDFDLIVKNGTIVTSRDTFRADIGVISEKIACIGSLDGCSAVEVYDADGKYVFPGFIDEHVHSRDPGLTHKEDFAHSTMSAAVGGITTVLEMPNSVPPVIDADTFWNRVERIGPQAFVDYGLWGMVIGDLNTHKLSQLVEAGVIGFKFFWGYALNKHTKELIYNFGKDDDVFFPPDEGEIYEAFLTIGEIGRPVAIHAENSNVIARLAAKERKNGADYASFLRSRPSFTEVLTIQSGITLAKAARVHLHILHIAAAEGVDLIRQARLEGCTITAETCPHYLFLSDEDWPRLGCHMKIYPPIREKVHQIRLWEGIKRGDLQAVGSDHAPHEEKEKVGDIWTVPAGACGVQTLAPLMLDAASKGRLTLNQVAALLSENPARIWGLYGKKGSLIPGADADLTIVDMERETVLRRDRLLSKNRIAPYDGVKVRGIPVATFVRGRKVAEEGKPVGTPQGRLVTPVRESQAWW